MGSVRVAKSRRRGLGDEYRGGALGDVLADARATALQLLFAAYPTLLFHAQGNVRAEETQHDDRDEGDGGRSDEDAFRERGNGGDIYDTED